MRYFLVTFISGLLSSFIVGLSLLGPGGAFFWVSFGFIPVILTSVLVSYYFYRRDNHSI